MKNIVRFALVILTLGMLAACGDDDSNPVAFKQKALYGTTLGTVVLGPSDLVRLNVTTGAFDKTIGSVGYFVNGLTHDDTTGKLYATTSDNDPAFPNGLIEINKSTGAGTPIGVGFGRLVNVPTVNSLGEMFGWTEDGDDLVRIDKVTGTATVIGDNLLGTAEQGLAFDNFDILVLVNPLLLQTGAYSVNTSTGNETLISTIPVPRAHHGDFNPVTNYYWGIDQTNDSAAGAAARNLLVLDVTAGTVIQTLPTVDYLHAVAFGYRYVFGAVSN
jgi:hypothetical protein